MSEPSRFRLVDAVLLLVILATAAGARVGYLASYADHAQTDGPFLVQDPSPAVALDPAMSEQASLVQNLKVHRWFGSLAPLAGHEERTAHASPGYPWLLGALEQLPLADGTVGPLMRWLQCGLGTLTAILYFLFARRAFHSRSVATLTGLLCALHPFWIIDTAVLNDGTLTAFLLAASLCLGARAGQRGGPGTSFLYGLALAAMALVRAALLPFAVVALLWFLYRTRHLAGGALAALLALLAFLTGLAPWMVRNFDAFEDVYPIVNSTYYHLWMGNNPQATGGPLPESILVESLAETRDHDVPATAAWLASLEQPERYRALAEPISDELRRSPMAALQRRIWAGLYFFFGEDWFHHRQLYRDNAAVDFKEPERLARSPYPSLLTGSLLAMLLLGVLGWRWTYACRREAMPSSLALMWVPLPYMLGHAEALSGPRLPLDGVLLCYAAFAVVFLLPKIGLELRRHDNV